MNSVFIYLESFKNNNRKEIITRLLQKVESDKKNSYCDYKNKEDLEKFLNWFVFGMEKGNRFSFNFNNIDNEVEVKNICLETLNLCKEFLNNSISIYIFPTVDNFVIKKMDGCSGFSNKKNNILIILNFVDGWQDSLRRTIVHEIAHAVSKYYNGGNYTLGEGFVLDGIAEHFRESIINGGRTLWTKAITEKEARKFFRELKNKLYSKDFNLYQSVFFGSKEYPVWTWYTIGYYLVGDYLKRQKEIDWRKIIKTPPKEILNEIIDKRI